jgi:hypothetical protein
MATGQSRVQRVTRLTDLLAQVLAGFVISVVGVVIIDGFFALIGLGEFGNLNGWLALVFPFTVFAGQFTVSKGERGRGLVAALGTVLAIGLGVIGATSFNNLPPIVSGGIGALVATVVYAAAWHIGLAVARRA